MFQSLIELISNPLVWKLLLGYWIFNAFAAALPQPNGSKFYQFFYRFIHTLSGNLDRAAQKFNVPSAEPKP